MEIEDIIINPESKYDPYLFRANSKTRLTYSKEYYNSHHNFKSQFEVIRDILEDDYISIFGFAVENDLKYIYDSCNRYNLKQPKLEAYDVRKMLVEHDSSFKGGLVENFKYEYPHIEVDDINHKSIDDAFMTSMLLKQVCNKSNLSIYEYLKDTKVTKSSFNESKHKEKEEFKKLKLKFNRYKDLKNYKPLSNEFKGINYSVSGELQKNLKLTLSHVTELYEKDAVMVSKLSDADYLIAKDQNHINELRTRLDTTNLQIVLYSELLLLNKEYLILSTFA